jgi:Transposase DDE domain
VERQLLQSIVAVLATLRQVRKPTVCDFSDEDIVKVHYWSVIHDRPVSWACQPQHWPIYQRRQALPSPSTMSRRLRTSSVRGLLNALERRVLAPKAPGLFWKIDGKPLPISGCSTDRQAGYGRAANGKAKGYKIHAIVGADGAVAAWRLAPMNKDERVMAQRMLRTAPIQGYVVGDSNYDSNKLHQICDAREQLQLVTRRRYGANRGTGHRRQTAGRLRSMHLTENPYPAFAEQLLHDPADIERRFAHVSNWGGGLTCLPPWVRTHRRVHRWVQAKLVLTALKRSQHTRTYAA